VSGRQPPMPVNPALLQHAQERRQGWENRVTDQITRFAGSIEVRVPSRDLVRLVDHLPGRAHPFGLPTMIVSLEAIFLSTFVMTSQNRAGEKRQALADQQWLPVQDEEQQNEELLRLATQILELTKASHAMSAARTPDA
jgi:uncharacterized membrane protein